jgi:hypothetical protein
MVLTLVAGLAVTVKHQPNFYRQCRLPPSEARRTSANNFLRNFVQMMAYIKDRQELWGCDATETEINSFFEETFVQLGEAESLGKLGISAPCLVLDGNEVRMAFRYGSGWFSTVISYDLKIWLVPKEPNVVAVQVLRARAGALPISCQSILQQLAEFAGKQNYKVTFYRHEGTPVAIVNLQPDQTPTATLTMLSFSDNKMVIRGKTSEHSMSSPPQIKMAPIGPTP